MMMFVHRRSLMRGEVATTFCVPSCGLDTRLTRLAPPVSLHACVRVHTGRCTHTHRRIHAPNAPREVCSQKVEQHGLSHVVGVVPGGNFIRLDERRTSIQCLRWRGSGMLGRRGRGVLRPGQPHALAPADGRRFSRRLPPAAARTCTRPEP